MIVAAEQARSLRDRALASSWIKPEYLSVDMTTGEVRANHERWRLPYAATCEDPHRVVKQTMACLTGQPHTGDEGISLEYEFRCRKCDACLRARQWQWTERSLREHELAGIAGNRTWFVTLTTNNRARLDFMGRAAAHYDERREEGLESLRWEQLTSAQRFRWINREIGLEITRWLKRLRHGPVTAWRQRRRVMKEKYRREYGKLPGVLEYLQATCGPKPQAAKFRYVLVTEAHQDGWPHHHLVVHEVEGAVREEDFRAEWDEIGFCKANLARHCGASIYTCKYIAKDMRARARASIGFGKVRPQAIVGCARAAGAAGDARAARRDDNEPLTMTTRRVSCVTPVSSVSCVSRKTAHENFVSFKVQTELRLSETQRRSDRARIAQPTPTSSQATCRETAGHSSEYWPPLHGTNPSSDEDAERRRHGSGYAGNRKASRAYSGSLGSIQPYRRRYRRRLAPGRRLH